MACSRIVIGMTCTINAFRPTDGPYGSFNTKCHNTMDSNAL